jgi:hypothetical protein
VAVLLKTAELLPETEGGTIVLNFYLCPLALADEPRRNNGASLKLLYQCETGIP